MHKKGAAEMWRFVFALPLIGHGLAHISGFLASWTSNTAGYTDDAWLFSPGITLSSPLGRGFGILWLVAAIALAGSGFGVLFQQDWWPTLAIVGSLLSLAAIVPWWKTVPPGARIGAAFDLLILIALLLPWNDQIVDLPK
jgi:hypothetical protein